MCIAHAAMPCMHHVFLPMNTQARLEHCMAACAGLPRDVVEAEERARQAQRRAAAREATLLQQRTEQVGHKVTHKLHTQHVC